ncbi:MAG: PAS domain S-box protein [Bryobacteraceae bacterium]
MRACATIMHATYLAAIVDSSDDAIIGARPDGVIETWNRGAENLYGYAAREMIGRHLALLESPEQPGEISRILERIARGETIRHHRTVRIAKDGARVEVSVTISPIRDAGGSVVGASAIARDMGERAALENALRFSEERYRSLALAGAQIVWTKNARGEVVEDWPMWRAFTGQAVSETTGRGWASAVHPEDRERIGVVWEAALRNGSMYETEYRLRRHDGEYRHMAVRGVPVLEPGGRVREWIGSCADITERKRAEEEGQKAQRELALKTRFATIFPTAAEPEIFAAVLDAILDHTHSAEGVFGYIGEDGALICSIRTRKAGKESGASQDAGAACETLRIPQSEWEGVWGRALREKRSLYSNEPGASPAGRIPVRRMLAVPIVFQEEPLGLFAIANKTADHVESDRQTLERIARDVAPVFKARLQRDAQERARKRAEEEVRTVNAELEKRVQERTAQWEAANHELESFAYSVSHDLRAPLRAIHGFSRILIEECAPELPGDAKHYLEVIRDNALQMGELIDDLLTLSRLSRQPLQKQAIAPADLVAQALDELRPEMGPRIEIAVGDVPVCEGDPVLLKQVFVNLLSNAIKYSGRRAQARIEVGALPRADGHAPVYFVRDNGVGFDMRYVHKLFGVFQRLHHAVDYPGTGVGLATVQRIIHRHGGRVWAESEIDRGATFYFTMEPEA